MTPLELLTRAARPATRLMDGLKLNSKLALIAAAFLVAAVGVSALLIGQINREVSMLNLQNQGQQAATKALELMVQLARHDIASQQDPARAQDIRSRVLTTQQELAHEIADLQGSERMAEAEQMLRDAVSVALEPEQDGNLVMQRHRGALDATLYLIELVADETSLNRVRHAHTFYLVRTAIDNVPLLLDRSFRLRALGALVIEAEAVWVEDRIDIVGATRDMDSAKDDLSTAVARLHAYEPDSRDALDRMVAAIDASTGRLRQQIQDRVLDAEEIEITERELDTLTGQVVETLAESETLLKGLMDRLLESRIGALQTERRLVVGGIVLALLVAGYLFIGFTMSVGRAMRQIGGAADDLARGVFRERVEVGSRDEMRQIADSMEKVSAAVRRFAAAQTEMADQHVAGLISHRIDAASFEGEYRRLAEGVNELVEAQIQMSMQAVTLMGHYGEGDLSEDMPELPGEKRRITDAMRTTKANLSAISAEIQRLVGAANAGDFSARGEAERFQHEFKRMIEGLNSLMAVSDSGLRDVGRVLDALAKGDLTESITADYRGQFDALKQAANTTVKQLGDLIGQVKEATDSINTAAREIAAGNSDLSARTEQQAASLEETASSMEELTSTVRQNAENARSANQLAIGAGEVAEKGGTVVSEVVGTMGEIDAASRKIVDIISVIDGIAFQTNILALNAAVEAARAGEQGRGFAVVAGEVRSLAQRSAAAAKEIKGLIGDTVDKIATGSALVDSAGKTMGEIVTSVKRVTDIMGEISAASAEQSSGIEQVNATVTQMDEVTQQNAALVEEASASARALEDQAGALAQAVSRFKLAVGGTASPTRPAASAPATLVKQKSTPSQVADAEKAEPAAAVPNPPRATTGATTPKTKVDAPVAPSTSAPKLRPIKPSAKPASAEGDDMEWTEF